MDPCPAPGVVSACSCQIYSIIHITICICLIHNSDQKPPSGRDGVTR